MQMRMAKLLGYDQPTMDQGNSRISDKMVCRPPRESNMQMINLSQQRIALMVTLAVISSARHTSANEEHGYNRLVRVVTISQDGLSDEPGKPMLAATITRLDRAASFRPDIVCLPETFTRGQPESVPGPTTDRLSRWAKSHACYVICPLIVRDGEREFNSAVLIDRTGAIVGRYDKIRPTEGELEKSICPGVVDPPIFQTDFGPVGIQICFDVNWRGQWQRLKEKEAKIIFFPSAYPAARQVKSLAWLNQCFIVSSTMTRAASIYDITGDPIATTGKYQRWTGAELPIGKRLFEIDYHIGKIRKIIEKYGTKVRVTWYHDDDLVSIASLDPQLTVEDLIDQFDLTPHSAYIQRAQLAQDERRVNTASN
jgi:beta-ureidopropionase